METKPIKRRSESFFGLHSDFHAKPKDGLVVGATLKEEDIREICETLQPDFIQVDCKGHPGWASYPTSFSNAMPAFAGDPLALWRRITKEYGIALYVHFSGIYENKYCEDHPEEEIIPSKEEKMAPDRHFARVDGAYVDTHLIPQIEELVERYQIDGVWLDGECWAVHADYHPNTIAKFEKATGIHLNGEIPWKAGDRYFTEYMEFTRENFREYLRHYTDVLHEKFPGFQVCSNWAFSDHMPEAVSANVDFLSGDLIPFNAVNSARYAGRMLAQQNMPWDLMSWNFRFQVYGTPLIPAKHPTQIMQEAAAVIALGGAYQDNIAQFPDGSPDIARLRKLRPLATFMREREPFCFGGRAIHQAAMLVSTKDRYKESDDSMSGAFRQNGRDRLMGLTALLCDVGQSLEIVGEHTLEGAYADYPLIIVPELYAGMGEDTVEKLREYVQNGGSLLLVGTNTARFFAERGFGFSAEPYLEIPELCNWTNLDLGHQLRENAKHLPQYFSLGDDDLGVTVGAYRIDVPNETATPVGFLHRSLRGEGVPCAQVLPFGKGKLAVVGMDLGTQYLQGMQIPHRTLIRQLADALYDPIVRVESAQGLLEVVCMQKDNRFLLQLVNGNGGHSNDRCVTEDYIPPITDIQLSVQVDTPPTEVVLQPENRKLPFEYRDGRIFFTVERVDIHSIVVMER